MTTDEEFIAAWRELGSPTLVANRLGINVKNVHTRRGRLEARGHDLKTWNDTSSRAIRTKIATHNGRIDAQIKNGVAIVFSDAHFWPGIKTTAYRALLSLTRQLNPSAIVCNGDAFDGATISRFPRPFFDESKPTVVDELKVCQERLSEVEGVANGASLVWCLGNHDLRLEARLAASVPEFEGVHGFHLKDWFPSWHPAWSYWINDEIEIRHRYRNGIHAVHTNVQANHHTTITGHLHSLHVKPYTDGRGIVKYGVDTGTLADADGQQFVDYLEGRQPNWRSGFVVLSFKDGQMLMPELVMKHDEDHVQFRGHLIHADTGEVI